MQNNTSHLFDKFIDYVKGHGLPRSRDLWPTALTALPVNSTAVNTITTETDYIYQA